MKLYSQHNTRHNTQIDNKFDIIIIIKEWPFIKNFEIHSYFAVFPGPYMVNSQKNKIDHYEKA